MRNLPVLDRAQGLRRLIDIALRLATLIIALLDTAAFIFAVSVTVLSGSDAATKGLDNAAGWAIVALFLLTAVPALVLLWRGRAPRSHWRSRFRRRSSRSSR